MDGVVGGILLNFSFDLQETSENSSISVLKLCAAKMRAIWSLLAFYGAILNAQLLLLLDKFIPKYLFLVDSISHHSFLFHQLI